MNVAVVGAGLAGLAAACDLADGGHRVTLFERRPWAGGKTYSFVDRETGEQIDNGQHIFMPCMTAYTAFLRRLGTLHLTRRQRLMRVPVFNRLGRRSDLWATNLPSPFHLGPSFAAYKHLSMADKVRITRALVAMLRLSPERRDELQGRTFGDWLRNHGQSVTAVRDFWDLIVVPTCNAPCDQVSASQALFVFQEGFLKSAYATAIGIPAVGLSRLHVEPAINYMRQRGGEIRLSCAIQGFDLSGQRVAALVSANGDRLAFDAYVLAVPPHDVPVLLPAAWAGRGPFDMLGHMATSPIVNLHLWYDAPVAHFAFAAFIGSELQWIFNRSRVDASGPGAEEHLVISLSAATPYMNLTKRELLNHFLPQVQRALPRSRGRALRRSVVIKEPDATFLAAPGLIRPGPETPLRNLFLAGAYTATGWPATMESAVLSGYAAARAVGVTVTSAGIA